MEINKDESSSLPLFRLEDGTAQVGYALTSDANGYATWQKLPTMGDTFLWKISNNRYYLSTSETKFTGTTTSSGDLKYFEANTTTSERTIPRGKYIISFYGDFFFSFYYNEFVFSSLGLLLHQSILK